jgi:anaphase-promoting complex subunit 8
MVLLSNLSLIQSGEQTREEEEAELADGSKIANPELLSIQEELRGRYLEGKLDGFCVYLYAMILGRLVKSKMALETRAESVSPFPRGQAIAQQSLDESMSQMLGDMKILKMEPAESEAFQRAMLIRSLRDFPWNWSTWLELTRTIKDGTMLHRIEHLLPRSVMKDFWMAHAQLELHRDQAALDAYLQLNELFPNNSYVLSQLGVAYHNLRMVDPALDIFEQVRKQDPFRISRMDIFSNVLYIKDERASLRHLAHHTTFIDKYTPETCCIVGNFFSLSGEHNRAILYYLRALKLDPAYIDAWTLVGHEYVELKDTHHAIAAYRCAVDSDPNAYRAWYGLGQAYELLCMPQYALYYYERAAEIRPHDARMWCALGACFEVMGQLDNALMCYHRAEANRDTDGNILHLIAELYRKLGRRDEAANYYASNLLEQERDAAQPQHIITALHYLTHYHKDLGNTDLAFQYGSRLVDFNGPEKEEVKSLLREMSASAASSTS